MFYRKIVLYLLEFLNFYKYLFDNHRNLEFNKTELVEFLVNYYEKVISEDDFLNWEELRDLAAQHIVETEEKKAD